jgi:hypothetical protein
MNNLQHERITVLAQALRLTALPDLYGGIAQSGFVAPVAKPVD